MLRFEPRDGHVLSPAILKFSKFTTTGAITTVIDIALFTAIALYLHQLYANIISYSTCLILSFILNTKWSFAISITRARAVRFAVVMLAGLALSSVVVTTLSMFIAPFFAKLLSVPVVFIWNYLSVSCWALST
jgi:putative flippase GtrA